MTEFILRQRTRTSLVFVALSIGAIYVTLTFDLRFLAGHGPFWDYPVGPWLQDSADAQDNIDILDYLIAYTGFVRTPWSYTPFNVARIGAPIGTSVVFLDVIPVAALAGRIISDVLGTFFLPYGAWIGLCFVLSPVCGTLMVFEGGQRSFLAAAGASIFAVSAPPLLHRFGHLPLMAHFLIIGALYSYLREQRPLTPVVRLGSWLAWLAIALLTNAYIFGMVGAVYAASLLRSWRLQGLRSRFLEPALIGSVVMSMLFMLGFVGTGASLSAGGYGYYSMNLLSPIVPQRSGLFGSMQSLMDSTGGQYEGFSYIGFGGLIILTMAMFINPTDLRRKFLANVELVFILLLLTAYALSKQAVTVDFRAFGIDFGSKITELFGIYRSSGRMFWPAYYALLLGGLTFVLNRIPRQWAISIVVACCIIQLIDTEPLRARMTTLTNHAETPLLDQQVWADRIKRADFVEIYPTFFCSDNGQMRADMELQLLAIRADRAFNVSYNPRLHPDCDAEAKRVSEGPWKSTTLYVFLDGTVEAPKSWAPPGLACNNSPEGRWCLGRSEENDPAKR